MATEWGAGGNLKRWSSPSWVKVYDSFGVEIEDPKCSVCGDYKNAVIGQSAFTYVCMKGCKENKTKETKMTEQEIEKKLNFLVDTLTQNMNIMRGTQPKPKKPKKSPSKPKKEARVSISSTLEAEDARILKSFLDALRDFSARDWGYSDLIRAFVVQGLRDPSRDTLIQLIDSKSDQYIMREGFRV